MVFKTVDFREWRTVISKRWEINERILQGPHNLFPGVSRAWSREVPKQNPEDFLSWIYGAESPEFTDRGLERRELCGDWSAEISRSRVRSRLCWWVWGNWGRSHPGRWEQRVLALTLGRKPCLFPPLGLENLVSVTHGELDLTLRRVLCQWD